MWPFANCAIAPFLTELQRIYWQRWKFNTC